VIVHPKKQHNGKRNIHIIPADAEANSGPLPDATDIAMKHTAADAKNPAFNVLMYMFNRGFM
jgi:hypothetical protein